MEPRSITFVKVSEHGLGHVLNPTNPDDPSTDWITDSWGYMVRTELGFLVDAPHWLNRPALTRVTASGPNVLRWFKGYNEGLCYDAQIKPANFLLLAHPDPMDSSEALPIAPYVGDASKWGDLHWVDRRTGQPVQITTDSPDGHERRGVVRVRTYRDVLGAYLGHPEAKSLGPNGEPVGRQTKGVLLRRGVEGVRPVHRIGKEANLLDDRVSGMAFDANEYLNEYLDPTTDAWTVLVAPTLATLDRSALVHASGLHRRTLERYFNGKAKPRAEHEQLLTEIALSSARNKLAEWGEAPPNDAHALLHRYLKAYGGRQAVCGGCGQVLTGRQQTWCSENCRSEARSNRVPAPT